MVQRLGTIAGQRFAGKGEAPAVSDVHQLLQLHLIEGLAIHGGQSDQLIGDLRGPAWHVFSSADHIREGTKREL
jgi:hypothetical protein